MAFVGMLLIYVSLSWVFAAVSRSISDREVLLSLHERVMAAHLQGNVDLLLQDESEEYVVVSRGEISRPSLAERRARFGSYLGKTRFSVYRDEQIPLATVSEDGTLGWVIAVVYALGKQQVGSGEEASIEFTSGWIELYEKKDTRWYRIGNISNFKA